MASSFQPPDWWKSPFRVIEVSINCWQVVTASKIVVSVSRFEDDAISVCHALNEVYGK